MEKANLILSIWGAGLATVLGIIEFIKFRRDHRIKLIIISTVELPFDQLQISIVNDGPKPATITHYSIKFGATFSSSADLIFKQIDVEKKVSESDKWTVVIKSIEIINEFKRLGLAQKPFCRLWASVQLSNGKTIWDNVYINPQVIGRQYYEKAEQFIATDLFLGLEQMNSEFYSIGIK
ncbi:hypothetical protein KBK19_17975 [Microvirga sp. STR05]|uniref:Uncharacterized protein n=1 Tax=Hymenobacter duratus TaxID=2771356 RepID=A0ABR8JMH4_9BACT|nr:hypothetical protein [Hymenobacter duratus]MBD2716938.1 hypothetical protein [Hymenobacter duratus]MBR7951854.1 hypothetical protein [Microvirga sp. STR05]